MDGRPLPSKLRPRQAATRGNAPPTMTNWASGPGWRTLLLEEALPSLEKGLLPKPSIEDFAHILQKCGKERDRGHALRLLAYLCKNGLECHRSLGNYLVSMLAEVGSIRDAQQVFDRLLYRNECSWNSLITGYIKCGKSQHAFTLYQKMQKEDSEHLIGHTFVALLKACAELKDLERGLELHAEVAKMGLLERELIVGNTLIDMYAKCGSLIKAKQVFDRLPVRNVVSWTALIGGYAEHGHGEEALKCFEEMQIQGVSPNAVTFVCSLKACSSIGATGKAREIHAEIERQGLLERDLFVGSALVDMYAKYGSLANAQRVFDRLPFRNVVSWNALIVGYAEHGHGEEVLKCFKQMQVEGVSPSAITLVCSLKACGSMGATDKIGEIHAEIERKGLLERNLFVGSTLVDMYAKCGSLAKAQQVFDKLSVRDVVSWTALMAGYAQIGESDNVFHIFDRMLGEGIKPDPVAFVVVLNACSRTGLFNKSQTYFAAMSKDYGIVPIPEHHACMVDIHGRAGQLDKALAMIKKMPFCPSLVVWHTVLGACRNWGNVEFGKQAFERAMQLDKKDAVAYVFMSHIYAGTDLHEEANKADAMKL